MSYPELAGDHATMVINDAGTLTMTFDDKGTGRVCGSCQVCCKLVPVSSIHKPAGVRCRHSKHGKGCSIYADRPYACRVWFCSWLADPETTGLPRPDRAHYVIDPTPDYITLRFDNEPEPRTVPVLQVWVDPAFPEAHRTPGLRAYMFRYAEKFRAATIVRFSNTSAITFFPPPISSDGLWHEVSNGVIIARSHDEREILENVGRTQW
jgi:Fe-S-cluster containining protein